MTGSLALLADSGHMLSDMGALGLAAFAAWIADRPATSKRTYGYYRAEILAALVNGATLLAVSGFILFEAWRRLAAPTPVFGLPMLGIAAGGLIVNLACLWVLHGERGESLNIRGAWLHVLSDTLGSVAAIAAAVLVWTLKWQWADPVASALIALLIIHSSWRLLAEAVSVLMESAPRGVNVDDVRQAMYAASGVLDVHDLHVWSITSGMDSLSAHVVVADDRSPHDALAELRKLLADRFGIDHVTLQIEPEGFADGKCGGHA
ncbi:MAG: cation transporter [Planctomycetia bacterium]|nr:cation transporter [Planctomycetia bacterium]